MENNMKLIRMNPEMLRESKARRQRLLEARRRHLLAEASKKKLRKEEKDPFNAKARGYGAADSMSYKGDGNAGGKMEDAVRGKKDGPIPYHEGRRRASLSERKARIYEAKAKQLREEARRDRLREARAARLAEMRESRGPVRESREQWLERRQQERMMESRRQRFAERRRAMAEGLCRECGGPLGAEKPKQLLKGRKPADMSPGKGEKPVTDSKKLREARLQLIRKHLAESRARRAAALKESAEDAVDTLEDTVEKNPVPGEDLADPKDSLENAKEFPAVGEPQKEKKPTDLKSGEQNQSATGIKESKKAVKPALKESQAYVNRKARLAKYLAEHMNK
jgi:hypothetical protein